MFAANDSSVGRGPSFLAAAIALALMPGAAFAATTATDSTDDTIVVKGTADAGAATDSQNQDYSVPTTTSGTKMPMVLRDIPQSVSIISQQRMEDQQLQSLGDVMTYTTGISRNLSGSDRDLYYSRGFLIDNYMVDGIPTYFESRWNLGDSSTDTALYDRVEVVRGANGLMTGTGNPSASI